MTGYGVTALLTQLPTAAHKQSRTTGPFTEFAPDILPEISREYTGCFPLCQQYKALRLCSQQ